MRQHPIMSKQEPAVYSYQCVTLVCQNLVKTLSASERELPIFTKQPDQQNISLTLIRFLVIILNG